MASRTAAIQAGGKPASMFPMSPKESAQIAEAVSKYNMSYQRSWWTEDSI